MLDKIIILGYALFLILGGYFGFKKGSSASLAMGVGSGLMILLGMWITTINPKGGWIFLNCISALLVVTFLLRLIKTQAFMPSGMLLICAVLFLIFCLLHLNKS